jgi:hypothetical protein
MRIKSQTTFVAGMLLFLGVVMLAMPVGMIYGTSNDGPVPAGVWIVAALFAPMGMLIAYLSGKQLVQRMRFGRWEVECPDGGGRLGQPLEVKLVPPQVVNPTGEVACNLVCFRSTGVRSSSQRAGSTRGSAKLFDTSWTLRAATFHPQVGLPITLPLPEFGLESTRGRKATVEWKLSVRIPADGTTHEMEFEIPISEGGKRPQDAAESIDEETERRERADRYRKATQAAPDS